MELQLSLLPATAGKRLTDGQTMEIGRKTDLGFVARYTVVDVPDDLDQLVALLLQADQEVQQILAAAKPSVAI